jgi:serine/threonine protein kinase
MSDQFCGLAEGLQIIHNDREENLKFLPANVSGPIVYGRHGDIKPGNILYFETGKSEAPEQRLVLANFGLGRLQTKYSRSKQDPRSLARTETYRSPKFDLPPKGLVSPASDIFSLGCVFLEYISWYILGTEAVLEDFTNMRIAHDIYGFDVDSFFNVTTEPNGEQDAELKPSVKEWIQKLKKHRFCNDYINQMLDVIQDHMLDPNPNTRWRSMQLVRELQAIKIACQRVPSFCTKNSNPIRSSLTEAVIHNTTYAPLIDIESKGKSMVPRSSTDGHTQTRRTYGSTVPTTISTTAPSTADPKPPSPDEDSALAGSSRGKETAQKQITIEEVAEEDNHPVHSGVQSLGDVESASDRTEFSIASSVRLQQRQYISKMAHELIGIMPRSGLNDSTVQKLVQALPDMLKAFSLMIGHRAPTSWHRKVMYFVYKHRE